MMAVLGVLLVALLVVALVVVLALSRWRMRSGPWMTSETVALHAIRRRIEVAQFDSQVKAEAVRARRRLQRELDEWEDLR